MDTEGKVWLKVLKYFPSFWGYSFMYDHGILYSKLKKEMQIMYRS